MDINNVDNEDEDIIIQGSSLYEHLHNLGYTDFESVTVYKATLENEVKRFTFIDIVHSVKSVFNKLFSVYLKIIQDDNVSKKQMETILNAKVLLDDHASTIHGFLNKYGLKSWKNILLKVVLFGAVISSSVYIPFKIRYKNLMNSFGLFILFCISYIKYTRLHAHRDLMSLISLQNDLFDHCKKGLKILKYGYKIKLNKGRCSQQFYDLTADRLKYLQPIMESIVKCLKHVSYTYYHVSLILVQLLPVGVFHEDLLTKFEIDSFELHGEINYQKLRNLYHIFILTQSEMLYLLAIAYDNHIWQESCKKIPELKLARILHLLIRYLMRYKSKLTKVVNAYYNLKITPMLCRYKGSDASRYQDLYMHLYLASSKLQIAYGHILSVLHNIDNDINENMTDENSVENTIQKLNLVQKDIETAKGFIEFSSLFLLKTQNINATNNHLEVNTSTPVLNSDMSVMHDSELHIMDEVFEEYIKDEYMKPLCEEDDEFVLYACKKDKSLFKNFMAELKDVLVEKQKTMSERESRALQRMRKNITNETTLEVPNTSKKEILLSPDVPNETQKQITDKICHDTIERKLSELSEEPHTVKSIVRNEENVIETNQNDLSIKVEFPISTISLPKGREFSLSLPPPFLETSEETFIGSGENSEDEIIEVENEK